jgi:hypothetical protein
MHILRRHISSISNPGRNNQNKKHKNSTQKIFHNSTVKELYTTNIKIILNLKAHALSPRIKIFEVLLISSSNECFCY